MKRAVQAGVFVDTAYWVARLNSRDAFHQRALALASQWAKAKTPLVSSDAVLLETANFFARSPLRGVTIRAIRAIRASPCEIEPLTRELLLRAEARFEAHADKQWSDDRPPLRAGGLQNADDVRSYGSITAGRCGARR